MVLASPETIATRRRELRASADLLDLAARLGRLLEPLTQRPLVLPSAKALLSRDGGVCPSDGARLVFDPLSPKTHRCPVCAREIEGERHTRAWIWRYHLWLSERAIHCALLGRLTEERALSRETVAILRAYAALYPSVPNRDNVLGPTRLFFSTYLESIWLTQLVIAVSLLDDEDSSDVGDDFIDLVRESAGLIASFDETWSNRQVWNNAALVAAGQWLADPGLVDHAVHGPHGLLAQLGRCVTTEGLWFEGENYHFFALRGFLLAAELLRSTGVDLYGSPETAPSLSAMYVAPLKTLLPDLTLPARGDAPYGVSVRQPRFAELWEIGWRRTGDPRLASLLTDLYDRAVPEREDNGLREIAEQETNVQPGCLRRSALGWKALLWMHPTGPRGEPHAWRPTSMLLRDTGVAVLRPKRDRYVSLECGGRPGGHGHPDLLHVNLYVGQPLLSDFGTGSYVLPSLQWYRSTEAHNAPGVRGIGQVARHGWCSAFAREGEWAWCQGKALDVFGEGTSATRTVVAGPAFVLDRIDVEVDSAVTVELATHPLVGIVPMEDADVLESGVTSRRFRLGHEQASPVLILIPRSGETVRRSSNPGPPTLHLADGDPLEYLVRSADGSGTWLQLALLDPAITVEVESDAATTTLTVTDGVRVRVDVHEQEVVVDDRGVSTWLEGRLEPPFVRAGSPRQWAGRIRCVPVDDVPTPSNWQLLIPGSRRRLGRAPLPPLGVAIFRDVLGPGRRGRCGNAHLVRRARAQAHAAVLVT
jgi:hypothetical protein